MLLCIFSLDKINFSNVNLQKIIVYSHTWEDNIENLHHKKIKNRVRLLKKKSAKITVEQTIVIKLQEDTK